ncbi:hypothetical protein WOC76_11185 [Methylocystis sp. IM3]|uniref:hypothetical protein n=1 Tax=unclassified Methylocystis TaxID=2625913 RepID=UPI0030FB53DE
MQATKLTILDVERMRIERDFPVEKVAAALGWDGRAYKRYLEKAQTGGAKPLHADFQAKASALFSNDNATESPGPELDGDPELAAMEAANRSKVYGSDNPFVGMTPEQLTEAAEGLSAKESDKARNIINAAAIVGLDALTFAPIKEAINKKCGVGKRDIDKLFANARAAHAARNAKSPEELAAEAAEAARKRAEEEVEARTKLRAELWAKVDKLATDPNLMQRVIDYTQAAGVVGEEAGIVGAYLTATSRLLDGRALCLLRRGAPASGKNYLTEKVLETFPIEDIIRLNSASPKALFYYGGLDDVHAISHKIVYVPEVAGLVLRDGKEHEILPVIRSIVSDGKVSFVVADHETRAEIKFEKEGPIALIMTSARSNVEDEMLTRLLLVDTDESREMTQKVVSRICVTANGAAPAEARGVSKSELIDFQRWLATGGPYDVIIPFADALLGALLRLSAPLRARRDVGNIIAAVAASAIVYSALRERDAEGRIVATMQDYEWAHFAFAGGLAAMYAPRADRGVVALVTVLERLHEKATAPVREELEAWRRANPGVDPNRSEDAPTVPDTVQVSQRQIKSALGIDSSDAVQTRIKNAVAAEIVEIVDPPFGSSRGRAAHTYRVKIGSKDLAEQLEGVQAIPTPEAVRDMVDNPWKQDPDNPFE